MAANKNVTESNGMVVKRESLGKKIVKGAAFVGGSMSAGAGAGFVANQMFPNLAPTALTTAVWTVPFLNTMQRIGATTAIAALPPAVTNLVVPAAGALVGLAGAALVKGVIAGGKLIGQKIRNRRGSNDTNPVSVPVDDEPIKVEGRVR